MAYKAKSNCYMKKVLLFNVAPSLPPELEFLETLSYNMWWCWNSDAIELFRRIDPQQWKDSGHNPFLFFSEIPQKRLESLVEDDGFMSHYEQVQQHFEAEVLHSREGKPLTPSPNSIAYFSLEFGIHESLKLYSGGLGCLAGDYLKSTSDMGLPLVAVGLLYQYGYFQQYLNEDAWQQEAVVENEIHRMPLKKACDADGRQIYVSLPFPNGVLQASVWRIDVGRVPLYLLDPNITQNPPEYRNIGTNIYDADRQTRLRQELLLGVGGFRALLALGYDPPVCHMNEGHAAFVSLARIAHFVKDKGLNLETAKEIVRRTNVFTTHTPVLAGNETFATDLVRPHLAALQKELNIDPSQVIAWGQPPEKGQQQELTMTILALRTAWFANGVSKLHGRVTRKMWSHLWLGHPQDEIPIRHITNGVHVASWLSSDNAVLFDRYLGPEWRDNPSNQETVSHISKISDEELWRTRELGRSRLIRAAREFGEKQLSVRNAPQSEIAQIKSVLHHDTLTIGFARRFATYKRATLILKNPERLEAILTNKERPVQIVFAGKAHPADDMGKNLIREIVHFARRPSVRQRMIFLENYDIRLARYLIQGVDVWLNTPRRPQEASGTSGMKAAVNGALNLSSLDGWWDEGYSPDCGWTIGHGEEYDNNEYQDSVESQALYNLLENEVISCFYDRSDGDVPGGWVQMMKASMKMALGFFTSRRMISDYEEILYKPAMDEYKSLMADDAARARALVVQSERLQSLWKNVKIEPPQTDRDISVLHVGDVFEVTALAQLGEIQPEEVDVEVYYGPVNAANEITESHAEKMVMAEKKSNNRYLFKQRVVCRSTGRYGLTARITPYGTDWHGSIPGFITWAEGS